MTDHHEKEMEWSPASRELVNQRLDEMREQIRLRKSPPSPSASSLIEDTSPSIPASGQPPWDFPPNKVAPDPRAERRIRDRGVEDVHDWFGRFNPEQVAPFIDTVDGALVYTDGEGAKELDRPFCDTHLGWWLPTVVSFKVRWWSSEGGKGALAGLSFFAFDVGSNSWSPLSDESNLVQELRGLKAQGQIRCEAQPRSLPIESEMELE